MTSKIKLPPGNIDDLERLAFPEHPVSLATLRMIAYAQHFGEELPSVGDHDFTNCDHCTRELAFIRETDPVLVQDESSRVLVEVAEGKSGLSRPRSHELSRLISGWVSAAIAFARMYAREKAAANEAKGRHNRAA